MDHHRLIWLVVSKKNHNNVEITVNFETVILKSTVISIFSKFSEKSPMIGVKVKVVKDNFLYSFFRLLERIIEAKIGVLDLNRFRLLFGIHHCLSLLSYNSRDRCYTTYYRVLTEWKRHLFGKPSYVTVTVLRKAFKTIKNSVAFFTFTTLLTAFFNPFSILALISWPGSSSCLFYLWILYRLKNYTI